MDPRLVDATRVVFPRLPDAPEETSAALDLAAETPRDTWVIPERGSVVVPSPAAQRAGARTSVTLRVFRFVPELGRFVERRVPLVAEGARRFGVPAVVERRTIDFGCEAEVVEAREEERVVVEHDTRVTRRIAVVTLRWPGRDEPDVQDDALPDELARRARSTPAPGR